MIHNNKKYVSFDPWIGGFSNIRQSYETIAAIAEITGRTIILPPKMYCLFFSELRDKSTFIDMFDALDKDRFTSNFDCIDYYDIEEYSKLENGFGYFDGVHNIAKCIEFPIDGYPAKDPIDRYVLHCGQYDSLDFNYFCGNRKKINLDLEDKFVHFPNNLFTQFYYHIYSDLDTRNKIRKKIKEGVRFKQKFFDLADKVKDSLGEYNAIHIRRNDFLIARTEQTEFQLDYLLDNIKDTFDYNLPLYIATDETDKSLFYFLRDYYDIKFLDKFYKELSDFDSMIVEQIICANANIFYGSELSTFTHYIHVMRGYFGKDDYHRIGTNYDYGKLDYQYFPWLNDEWRWGKIYELYWKDETKKEFKIHNLGIFGSHNAGIAISENEKVLEVVEIERWTNTKNGAFLFAGPQIVSNPYGVLYDIIKYFKRKYNISIFENVYHNSMTDEFLEKLNAKNYIHIFHHEAHSANALYQSNFNKVLNVSFDGGSESGFFKIYLCERGKQIKEIYNGNKDLAVSYQTTAHYINEIKKEDSEWTGNLIYSGKIMGLSSYGNLDDELIKKYRVFYRGQNIDDVMTAHQRFRSIFGIDDNERIGEELGRNMAACNQFVFNELFKEEVQPFIDMYVNSDTKLIFSGGGSMNIINNTLYDAFVSPNSDDRGIALGCLLWGIKPKNQIDATYLGSEPYDELPEHTKYSVEEVVNDLINGKILGVIQGRSEHGARALGNRSIICLPKKGMKEILNDKVKRRESFRPFAPMCTLEDAPTYFEFGKHSRWMTHNAIVKDGFEEELGAIIHIDGTARLQTVTEEQNEFMYKILIKLKELGYPPVILNTSFNIQGKPILNRYEDALWMRDNTGLDKVITDKFILK